MENNNVNRQQPESLGSSIDYKAMALRLWAKRVFIAKVLAVFFTLGMLTALFQRPVYTASCTFVPQGSSKNASSSLSALGAMAGINVNLANAANSQSLPPLVIPQLLQNVELRKELMRAPLSLKKYDGPVSLYDLATNPDYHRVTFRSVIGTIKTYTIGLPGVIIHAITGDEQCDSLSNDGTDKKLISQYSQEEYELSKVLDRIVSISLDKKEGYFILSARYNEPVASAQICRAAFDLLDKYVTEFKLQNASNNEAFLASRYEEAKVDYEAKQLALAKFVDANRGVLTATATIRKDKLRNDYNLAYAMFTEISKRKLQAEMQTKEDTPVLSPVQPVYVPMQKSNSRSKTLFSWVMLGLVFSCGSVFALDWLKKKGLAWPKNWTLEI